MYNKQSKKTKIKIKINFIAVKICVVCFCVLNNLIVFKVVYILHFRIIQQFNELYI